MKMNQGFKFNRHAVFAALLVGAMSGAQAGEYSNVYFFGDSLTDSGVYGPLVGENMRFTTNPGTVWAENLGQNYGVEVSTAYAASMSGFALNTTGNNFAIGGARVNATPGILSGPLEPLAPYLPPVSQQVSGFLARGPLDSSALYAVWAGANDVFAQAGGVAQGLPVATAMANMATVAGELSTEVAKLQAAGARNLIVINVPDIGNTPYGNSQGAAGSALLTGLSSTYDSSLAANMAGKNVLYFDGARLFTTILANPAAYGFTNTSTPACGAESSLGCNVAANGYMFADGVHPSTSLHQVLSDWVYASLEGGSSIASMSLVPMGRSGAQWRSMDGRMQQFQNFDYKGQGFFVTGDYASSDRDAYEGTASTDGSGGSVVMGYEKAFTDQLFGGVTLGYGQAPFDLGNDMGTVKYNEWALSAFASHKFGAFYANALATYSWLDYSSKRNIVMGPFHTSEKGDTNGNQFGVKAQVGYNFTNGTLVHGPLAGLAWERVRVDGFSEDSGSVTAMTYGDQTRESLRSRLGWQVAAETQWSGVNVRPYAQLSYDYEHKKDERSYSVGFVGSASSLSMTTANQTGGYATLQAGLNAELANKMNLGVGAMTTMGQPGGHNAAINVTLSAPY